MIELENISKNFTSRSSEIVYALKDISLRIDTGESLCIYGKSGSGKSTLLDIIATFSKPSSGNYYYKHRSVLSLNGKELYQFRAENIGFVFQSFNLLKNLDVTRNILLPTKYSSKRFEHSKKLNELSESLEISDLLGRFPSELSGGQQQRVAIARALINDPDIILADEPTGNLDTRASSIVLDCLTRFKKDNKTLIMVTHNSSLYKHFDRGIEILDGDIYETIANV